MRLFNLELLEIRKSGAWGFLFRIMRLKIPISPVYLVEVTMLGKARAPIVNDGDGTAAPKDLPSP
jgi:hypothetical protein